MTTIHDATAACFIELLDVFDRAGLEPVRAARRIAGLLVLFVHNATGQSVAQVCGDLIEDCERAAAAKPPH